MRKIHKIIFLSFLILVIFVFIFWLFSIIICEFNTRKYSDVINNSDNVKAVSEFIGEYESAKVLSVSNNEMQVYYIEKNYNYASIILYKKFNDNWKVAYWGKCIWSKEGSADDVVWPYWWHFIYFL